MFRTRLVPAAMVAVLLSTAAAYAAEPGDALPSPSNLAILLDTIRANRKAMVAVNLELGSEEAAKFWPLYDRYQQQLNPIGDRQAALIKDYIAHFGDLSNEKALKLVEDYLAADADRIKVRREFVGEFAAILPGRTVARLYQIENKMDALIRYDLAATIPVVEQARAPAPQ